MKKAIVVLMILALTLSGVAALAEAGVPGIEAYLGTWMAGRAVLTIEATDDGVNCEIRWGSSASEEAVWIYEGALYDEVSGALTTFETGVKANRVYGEGGELVSEEIVFDDGAASFALGEDGTLTWTDFKRTPGENEILFERVPTE